MTITLEYFERREKPPEDQAKKILFEVFGNILDRRGFRQNWDQIDEDVKIEILETNLKKVQKHL